MRIVLREKRLCAIRELVLEIGRRKIFRKEERGCGTSSKVLKEEGRRVLIGSECGVMKEEEVK